MNNVRRRRVKLAIENRISEIMRDEIDNAYTIVFENFPKSPDTGTDIPYIEVFIQYPGLITNYSGFRICNGALILTLRSPLNTDNYLAAEAMDILFNNLLNIPINVTNDNGDMETTVQMNIASDHTAFTSETYYTDRHVLTFFVFT